MEFAALIQIPIIIILAFDYLDYNFLILPTNILRYHLIIVLQLETLCEINMENYRGK